MKSQAENILNLARDKVRDIVKLVNQEGAKYRLPSQQNFFQERMYIHLIDWKRKNIGDEPGMAGGVQYDAVLPNELAGQLPLIYPPIRGYVEGHRQRFPFRIHKYFNHMASSQAANINLFLPILYHPRAGAILGRLKPDLARLATEQLDGGYRIEFWDEPHGCLGDKTEVAGTDADLGIAYYNHEDVLCLWLIEHKLTESEFTTCGGFRSRGRKPWHDCGKTFAALVREPASCYYHEARKFNYWRLTTANQDLFPNHAAYDACPFRDGMNQLWRNQLLGVGIEQDERQPYQKVSFSVVRHPENNALDKTIAAYQHLTGGNPRFTSFTSADVVDAAVTQADEELLAWVAWYRELYDL